MKLLGALGAEATVRPLKASGGNALTSRLAVGSDKRPAGLRFASTLEMMSVEHH
jgi:hypothetical protein